MEQDIFVVKKRLEIYEFLSFAFLNVPSEELIMLIKNNFDSLKELSNEERDFLDISDLETYIQQYYDRFFVPTSKSFVPPHEAAILNRKIKNNKLVYGKLDSDETFHVKMCYEMVDFKVDDLKGFSPLVDNHYPDHIAFELAFIDYLVKMELKAFEDNDKLKANKWKKLQKDFITLHLNKWIKDYSELINGKGKDIYAYLINLTSNWIEIDLEYLNDEN